MKDATLVLSPYKQLSLISDFKGKGKN